MIAKSTKILSGMVIAEQIMDEIKKELNSYVKYPKLMIIFVGSDESSKIFVRNKLKVSEKLGIDISVLKLPENVSQKKLKAIIKEANEDELIDGILVQLPLPKHIDENELFKIISPEKDVDCLSPRNIGNLTLGKSDIVPATVEAVLRLLENYSIDVDGKNVTIINRSSLIGKPLALELVKRSATVTICHSKTKNLSYHTKHADIVITATGVPNFLKENMISERTVIIDIGCTKLGDKVVGDFDEASCKTKVKAFAPVPGGIGPITVAATFLNLIKCIKRRNSKNN